MRCSKGDRVYFRSQQFPRARWFGTARVVSYDPVREEYVTERDPGSEIDHIAPLVQTWPADHVLPARYQVLTAPEDGPVFLDSVTGRRVEDLGCVHGVHFVVSDLWPEG